MSTLTMTGHTAIPALVLQGTAAARARWPQVWRMGAASVALIAVSLLQVHAPDWAAMPLAPAATLILAFVCVVLGFRDARRQVRLLAFALALPAAAGALYSHWQHQQALADTLIAQTQPLTLPGIPTLDIASR
ncbi:MAG: hypothetical protein AAF458_09730 [Pseudomonadota bacterium]